MSNSNALPHYHKMLTMKKLAKVTTITILQHKHFTQMQWVKKLNPQVSQKFIPIGWECLTNILHADWMVLSMLNYSVQNCIQLTSWPSVLWLLVGWQDGNPACKNWVVGCWCGYLSGARCRLAICIWPSWCHCHSMSLASVKSRLVYLAGTGLPV